MARRPPSCYRPLTGAALLLLLAAPGCRRAFPPAAAGETVAVVRVVKTSALPDPAKNPYGDCLVVLKGSVERVESGAAVSGDLLLALWGFRDRTVQPAAAFRPGMQIRVRLTPWAKVSKEIESLQQMDDVGEYTLPLYFAPEVSSAGAGDAGALRSGDETAAAARRRAMDADLARIEALKSRHGGDYAPWKRELAPLRSALLAKMAASREPLAARGERLGENHFLVFQNQDRSFAPAVATLVRLREELARRGTDLVVVPIPWKEEVIAPLFTDGVPDDGVLVPDRVAILEALLRADIETVDLFPPWREGVLAGEPVFFETVDVHPADRGVQIAAHAIAARLERYRLPRTESFVTRRITFSPPETERTFPAGSVLQATQVLRQDGRSLGEGTASPLLVIGDCFVFGPGSWGAEDAGPVAHLAKELGFVPASLGQSGGASHIMVTLARKGPAFLEGRRVAVFLAFVQYFFVPSWHEEPGSPYQWTVVALPRPGEPAVPAG